MHLAAGNRLGPYEILALLGAGGMGEVYRARDSRLGREVAVKVLHANKLTAPGRRQRFLQEARTVSALNHPNIVTIHDIGTEGETVYMVMELIEGTTLDRLIPEGGLPVPQILRYATQIANAFDKAHASGIVHRDLKPANVMISADGKIAKVLDFGLAKLTEQQPAGDDEETRTAGVETQEGTVMGTASYMSPEQAEGKPVDARSDIFSFGAMLYELCSGRRAFKGTSHMSTIAAVLREEPRPLADLRPDVPPELVRLVMRCLRKEPARRAQSMADLKVALQELRDEAGAEKAAHAQNPAGSASPPTTAETTAQPAPERDTVWSMALWVGLGVALAGLIVAAVMWTGSRGPVVEAPLLPIPFTSFPGSEVDPGFSPDGNQVVFSWNGERADNSDIYVKLIGTDNPLRLTTDPAVDQAPHWSPDGRSIAFIRQIDADRFAVMLVQPLGGAERKVGEFFSRRVIGPTAWVCWASDSRHLIVSGSQAQGEPNRLLLVSAETGEAKTLAQLDGVGEGFHYTELSPDGRQLASVVQQGLRRLRIWPVEGSGGDMRLGLSRTLETGTGSVLKAAWTADSREIVFSINSNTPQRMNRIAATGGPVRPIEAIGRANGRDAVISGATNRMIFVQRTHDANIWQLRLDGDARVSTQMRPIAVSSFRDVGPQYSPDGRRMAFYSNRGGDIQIWTANADGTGATQLTSMNPQATTGSPAWSPDSRTIAFDSDAGGGYHIYVMGADGGKPRAITTGSAANYSAAWSPDGRWIYFASNRSGAAEVWRAPAEGGEPEQKTRNGGQGPALSADGAWLYFTKGDGLDGIWRMPVAGGAETRIVDNVYRTNYALAPEGIYWVPQPNRDGTTSVRYMDLATKASKEIAKIQKAIDYGLSLAPDGKSLLFTQRDYYNEDLMLVENFR